MELLSELGEEPDEELVEPQLATPLYFYVTAFWRLSTERAGSMNGISPIPLTSVIIYAERYCVSRSQQERLIDYVMRMDVAYINARSDTGDDDGDSAEAECSEENQ